MCWSLSGSMCSWLLVGGEYMESDLPYQTISTSVKAAYCCIKQLTCHQTFQQLQAGGKYWQKLLFDKTQDTIKHTHTHNTIALNPTLAITLGSVNTFLF